MKIMNLLDVLSLLIELFERLLYVGELILIIIGK